MHALPDTQAGVLALIPMPGPGLQAHPREATFPLG